MMGAERKSLVMSEEDEDADRLSRGGPCHRSGLNVPRGIPVHKATIIRAAAPWAW